MEIEFIFWSLLGMFFVFGLGVIGRLCLIAFDHYQNTKFQQRGIVNVTQTQALC